MWQRVTKILGAKKIERQECLSNQFFNIDYISGTISQPKKKKSDQCICLFCLNNNEN